MRPVFIFDLDGTILSVNSFPHWAAFLLRARLPQLRPVARVRVRLAVAAALARRKLGLMPHAALKWRLQFLWQSAVAGDGGAAEAALLDGLMRHVRPDLAGLLAHAAAGRIDAVLATAAAAEYADGLGRRLGFRHVLATPSFRAQPGPSNLGAVKRDAVLSLLRRQGWEHRPRVLFTDHRDDLPLIQACGQTVWYGPDARLAEIRALAPAARITPAADFALASDELDRAA